MAKTVVAHVARADGSAFTAEVTNLTTASLFLVTREPFKFREQLSVSMFGLALEGEVALTIAGPIPGVVVAFVAPAEARGSIALHLDETATIESRIRGIDHREAPLLAPEIHRPDSMTDPVPAIRLTVQSQSADSLDNETLDDLKLDADTVHEASPIAVSEDPTPEVVSVVAAPDLYRRPPLASTRRQKPDPVPVAKRVEAQSKPAMPIEAVLRADLPIFRPDDMSLEFGSLALYRIHHDTTIANGGIIARGPPLPLNTELRLTLRVLGVDEALSLDARVGFVGKDGTLGFVLEDAPRTAPMLAAIARLPEPSPTPQPRLRRE